MSRLTSASQLSDDEQQTLADLAASIGTDTPSLAAIMAQESSFDPVAMNDSGHGGLIQISNANAAALGYGSSQNIVDTYSDRISQMQGPVLSYFNYQIKHFGPINSFQDLCMAVYSPAQIGKTSIPADCQTYVGQIQPHLSDTSAVSWPVSGGSLPDPGTASGSHLTDILIIIGALAAAGGLFFFLNSPKKRG